MTRLDIYSLHVDSFLLRPSSSKNTSVGLSFNLSVRLSRLLHNVAFILASWIFQELIPLAKVLSMQRVKVRCQRSRSQNSKHI